MSDKKMFSKPTAAKMAASRPCNSTSRAAATGMNGNANGQLSPGIRIPRLDPPAVLPSESPIDF